MKWRCSEQATKTARNLLFIHSGAILDHRGNNAADPTRHWPQVHQNGQPTHVKKGAVFHSLAFFNTGIPGTVLALRLIVRIDQRNNMAGDIREAVALKIVVSGRLSMALLASKSNAEELGTRFYPGGVKYPSTTVFAGPTYFPCSFAAKPNTFVCIAAVSEKVVSGTT